MGTHRSRGGAEGSGLRPDGGAQDGGPAWRNLHGRRRGKALKPAQARWMRELLPRLAIPGVDRFANPARAPIDPSALFGDARPLWLEIGFGGGEHLLHQAEAHPSIGLIGCEAFLNGTAKALARIGADGIGNIRIHPGDARDLLDVLPEGVLARVFLLYPDPWPKTRHKARRFVNVENLAALERVMAPGAELRLATDIPDYVAHARWAVRDQGGFEDVSDPKACHIPWEGWQSTRYETKALRSARTPHYLSFRRGLRTGTAAPVDQSGPIS